MDDVTVIPPVGTKDPAEFERSIKRQLRKRNPDRRHFAVRFRDGKVRMVIPDRNDPLQFKEQLYTDESGTALIMPD